MSAGHSAALRELGRTRPQQRRDRDPLPTIARHGRKPRGGYVGRPALVHTLAEAHGAALALVVAPPGYGKSALLANWAEYDERPFVWLAPGDRRGGSPHLVDGTDGNGRTSATGSMPPNGRDSLIGHVHRTCRRHEHFVLVLDDADLLQAPVLRDVVETALEELPEGSMMALASRSELPLPLGRLRAHGLLSEIRMQELAMTSAEAAALLGRAGVNPEFEVVQSLVRRTEGWPAALSLAAVLLRESPQGAIDVHGEDHLVSEYVRDEVLAPLPAELQTFALQTSVLEELGGPICDAVLRRCGSGSAIRKLAAATPLLLPMDRAHRRYRWHTLVREVLGSELQCTDPELERTLRLRAAAWYADSGDVERAIDQCSAAGEAELTGDLLWPNVLTYLTSGKAKRVLGWISHFESSRIDSVPLALSAAFSALVCANPDEVQRWGLAAAAAQARSSGEREGRSLATGLALIETIDAHDGVGRMAERAIEAARSEPVDSLWRPLCFLLAGVAAYLQGDRAGAQPRLDEAVKLSGSRAPALTSLCIAQRAMIAIEQEDWELADELTERARTLLEEWGLGRDPLSAFTYAAAAAAKARQRRIDEAKHDLRLGVELLAALGEFTPWYDAQARILLAHASLSLADVVAARALLAEASRFARKTHGALIFSEWFDRAWGRMDTLTETSLVGPSALTIAELRILRFLPTHRSFREIAAQLGVSANTVKTQAHAVYRKLGVASRSEAVSRAIEAGLLG